MGNSNVKQHYETAKKTGVLTLTSQKLTEFPTNLIQLESNLRTLDISENKFVQIPNTIGSFSQLKHLKANNNRLTSLPDALSQLSKLESLSAESNRISTIPPSLNSLNHLKQVFLSGNKITQFPMVFCEMNHLDILDLSRNQIQNVPDGIGKLQVAELNLNQNQISHISTHLAHCQRLKTLRLEENCLQIDSVPKELLTDSFVSMLAIEGNLFDMKSFHSLDGYDLYMDRYTAVKKKMF